MKKNQIEFKCPRCGCKAFAYSRILAGCSRCGVLLYTEIPQDVAEKFPKFINKLKYYLSHHDDEIKNSGAV